VSTLREAAEEALRWMEHARLHLTIKERMHPDGLGLYDNAAEALRAALAQPEAAPDAEVRAQHKEFARWFLELGDKSALASEYLAWLAWKAALAHPPRNEWREAVHDELVTTWTLSAENKDDPRKALQDIINWHVRVALDPAVSSDAQALIERGKAMRDEWRLASEPPEDLRRRVIAWRSPPQRQSGTWVEALYDDGAWVTRDGIAHDITHWRDVTPPTEGE